MDITNSFADLQELLVLLNSLFEFTKVVVEDSSRVVSAAFITRLTSSLAGEGKHIVVLQTFLSSNSVVGIRVAHHQSRAVLLELGGHLCRSIYSQLDGREYLLVLESLLSDDVFLALGSIEVNRQFNTLGLVHSEGEVGLLLQVLELEALEVLFSEGLSIELSCSRSSLALLHRAHERLLVTTRQAGLSITVTYNELFMLFNY